ncbi:MAG: precorrin-6A reductase [Desulfotomaculales bacterium]
MILLLGGTSEAREAARALQAAGFPVLVSVATPYGAERSGATEVVVGKKDAAALASLISARGIRVLIDATHPFAAAARSNAASAAAMSRIPCLRFTRPREALPEHPLVHQVPDCEAAAALAVECGPVVFLTVGSRTVNVFAAYGRARGCRIVARVLPVPEALAACREAGLSPCDIVALEGPVGEELNVALFRAFGATVVVARESGERGGLPAKVKAALKLGIPVVVVRRPPESGTPLTEVEALVKAVSEILRNGGEYGCGA